MPYSKSTQKDYGDNPLQKRSGFKMKGMDFGNSPLADKGEVVSKTSPGPGWTKTKGTNIWAPPKGEMMAKVTKLKRKVGTNFATVRSDIKMKPPYKKPVGPIVD